MSRAFKLASAAVVAVAVESASVWVLTHVVVLDAAIAFAMAFAAGYLALFAAISILRPSGANSPLRAQLWTYGLFGLAVLLIADSTQLGQRFQCKPITDSRQAISIGAKRRWLCAFLTE